MSRKALVLGIGNRLRRDDGVGPYVADEMSRRGVPGLASRSARGEECDFSELWEGYSPVFLVDAARSGAPAGTLHVFDVTHDEVPIPIFGRSTHSVSLAEAVALAKALGKVPSRLFVLGIEAEDFGLGEGFSPVIEEKLPSLIERIEEQIRRNLDARG